MRLLNKLKNYAEAWSVLARGHLSAKKQVKITHSMKKQPILFVGGLSLLFVLNKYILDLVSLFVNL